MEKEPEPTPEKPHRVRRLLNSPWTSRSLTVVACLTVFVALLYPNVLRRVGVGSFARIPIEAAVIILLLIVLPRRPRIAVASTIGVLLGWLVVEKSLDMGFFRTLARPFDPVLDWSLFGDAYNFVNETYGGLAAWAAVIGALVLGLSAPAFVTWAMLRVAALLTRHRRRSAFTATGIAAAWMLTLALGVQLTAEVPLAARTSATYVWDRIGQAREGLENEAEFAAEVDQDPYHDVPPDQLLTALRGKDFVLTFIESYGRNAIEAPEFAETTGALLADGDTRLKAAGFAARSGWLTSPTFGGSSWLAHSTLLSGLWINNQSRYRNLNASQRLTLTKAFKSANWDTVAMMPGNSRPWPESEFYGYNRVWDSRNLGYQGPKFGWASMPDQYTLTRFNELEYTKPGRAPLMVEMPLLSTHTPWAPIPSTIGWDQVGDGSVYHSQTAAATRKSEIWNSTKKVRKEYGKSVVYTMSTLIDWIQRYGDDNLVLVFLGDHQPSSVVSGDNASHDVPITIVAKDPAVLDRITSWGWTDSLKPAPDAPVWPMSDFRDKFLTAYGPDGAH
ncbi:sulfatase-like hydrolase/transferase [Actinoplanes sp. NPDC049802]|uniref:sulfatase-like hydrolase/transferase n=1 Tax=Actinoplanes sp. NPDC049802 TaxID=3154742 RepID=UPI0033D36354